MARELRIYERPSTLERPVLIGAFRGWNDGGQAATLAAGYLARLWGARKFADIDPELFVDFQASRPHGLARGGANTQDRMAREHVLPCAHPRRRQGRDPPRRGRAELPVAQLLRDRHGPRRRPRRRACRDARRARRRRTAHEARAGHRRRHRPAARRRARAPALALRRPDGDRRRSSRLVPSRRDSVGEPVGGRSALRPARAEPAGGQGAL